MKFASQSNHPVIEATLTRLKGVFGAMLAIAGVFAAACATPNLPAPAPTSPVSPEAEEPPAPSVAKALTEDPLAPPAPSSGGSGHAGHAGHSHAAHRGASPAASETRPATTDYVCPMHPEVRQATQGNCPKCGMKLVPATGDATPDTASSTEHPHEGHAH